MYNVDFNLYFIRDSDSMRVLSVAVSLMYISMMNPFFESPLSRSWVCVRTLMRGMCHTGGQPRRKELKDTVDIGLWRCEGLMSMRLLAGVTFKAMQVKMNKGDYDNASINSYLMDEHDCGEWMLSINHNVNSHAIRATTKTLDPTVETW